MSAKDTAYVTWNDEVLGAWNAWVALINEVDAARTALREEVGREMWMSRSGFGTSSRIIGFEPTEDDNEGDLLLDGALIVSSKRGSNEGRIVPNLKRKAGKAFAGRLVLAATPDLQLPGKAAFHIYADDRGMYSTAGQTFPEKERGATVALYVLWPCDNAPMDDNLWTKIPLSDYYLAREKYEAEQEQASDQPSDG